MQKGERASDEVNMMIVRTPMVRIHCMWHVSAAVDVVLETCDARKKKINRDVDDEHRESLRRRIHHLLDRNGCFTSAEYRFDTNNSSMVPTGVVHFVCMAGDGRIRWIKDIDVDRALIVAFIVGLHERDRQKSTLPVDALCSIIREVKDSVERREAASMLLEMKRSSSAESLPVVPC